MLDLLQWGLETPFVFQYYGFFEVITQTPYTSTWSSKHAFTYLNGWNAMLFFMHIPQDFIGFDV